MKTRLTAEQEKYIAYWQKTLDECVLLTAGEMARLAYKDSFKTNMPRLRKRVTDRAIIGLRNLNYMMMYLPEGYKKKVMDSPEYKQFFEMTARDSRSLGKPESAVLEGALESLYESLAEVNKYVPEEFRPLLREDLEPFVKHLQSIMEYTSKTHSKKPLKVKPPAELLPTPEDQI